MAKAVTFNIGGGGLGKMVMATAVIRAIAKQYPKHDLHIIVGQPQTFENNPHIAQIHMPHQYQYSSMLTYYSDIVFLTAEPYHHRDYISGKLHLVEAWCDAIGVKCDGTKPELYLTPQEKINTRMMLKETRNKTLLLHLEGGSIKDGKKLIMFHRDLPPQTQVLLSAALKNEWSKLLLWQEGHTKVPNTIPTTCPTQRELFSLIYTVDKIITIDTCTQHIAAAFDKQCVVLWGATSPKSLGYDLHINLTNECDCETPACGRPNSFIFDMLPDGRSWQCPLSAPCCDHDVVDIVEALEKVK